MELTDDACRYNFAEGLFIDKEFIGLRFKSGKLNQCFGESRESFLLPEDSRYEKQI